MSRNQLSNLKISLKGLLLIAILFIGCQDDEPDPGCSNGKLVNATGFDGCGWLIELFDGTRLEPVNLEDFDIALDEDLPICVEYDERTDLGSICMTGTIVEITSIVAGTRID